MTSSPEDRASFKFPVTLTITSILCLAAIQVLGVNAAISLATAGAVLVICSLRPDTQPTPPEQN